jgi:hypothetical protein
VVIRIKPILVVLAILILAACRAGLARDPISPLYADRLAATLSEWEMGGIPPGGDGEDVTWWPISVQPASFCAGSACLGSTCLGSLCVESNCLGSGCVGSVCLGSGCLNSACIASGCVGSVCGGSACAGATLCLRTCGDGGGPAFPINPEFPNPGPSTSPMNCPEN